MQIACFPISDEIPWSEANQKGVSYHRKGINGTGHTTKGNFCVEQAITFAN
jgi:hypothetical protein